MTEIAELWRLPDKQVTKMDGSPAALRRLAIRQTNWRGWYKVLPDYDETIKEIPEGSVPLILGGVWLTNRRKIVLLLLGALTRRSSGSRPRWRFGWTGL